MGANYSFEMDNKRFSNQIKLMKIGSIIMLTFSVISFFMAILFFTFEGSPTAAKSYTIWFFEIVNASIVLPAMVLLLVGFNELRNNIEPDNNKLLKSIRISIIFFVVIYIIYTAISLPIHIIDDGYGWITLGKNLVVFTFISAIMFQTSFLFNKMQKIGYPTRMLFVPIIFLPVPSVIGFILGFFVSAYDNIFLNLANDGALRISAYLVYTYLSICFIATFIEFMRIISKMIVKVEENITTNLETNVKKKDNLKVNNKEKTKGKSMT
ncbi:MAG: hypothetical protein JXA54_06210 [Candidatus Heimdallarchaeota archaeon]|nr:hypothetical protein [Candidatus Heimdallarchaeota archaeon]